MTFFETCDFLSLCAYALVAKAQLGSGDTLLHSRGARPAYICLMTSSHRCAAKCGGQRRIGLSDTFFLTRSSEKRYEFIRYTETYQFTQLHTLLSASPHATQSEFKSEKCGLKKGSAQKKPTQLCSDFE